MRIKRVMHEYTLQTENGHQLIFLCIFLSNQQWDPTHILTQWESQCAKHTIIGKEKKSISITTHSLIAHKDSQAHRVPCILKAEQDCIKWQYWLYHEISLFHIMSLLSSEVSTISCFLGFHKKQ